MSAPVWPPIDPSPVPPDENRRSARWTRRAFLTGSLAAAAGVGAGWWTLRQPPMDGVPWPLRRILEFNEWLTQPLVSDRRLAREFPPRAAQIPKVNGWRGLADATERAEWRLHVASGEGEFLPLPLAALEEFPRVEMVTELCCVEGWSEVVRWGGVRLRDVAAKYLLPQGESWRYVAMETPDGGYYVGLDTPSALHPQTLLCDSMNGAPLPPEHGGPLRLVCPLKYGYKSIKQLGRLRFTNTRPRCHWAERGYDWFAGL